MAKAQRGNLVFILPLHAQLVCLLLFFVFAIQSLLVLLVEIWDVIIIEQVIYVKIDHPTHRRHGVRGM